MQRSTFGGENVKIFQSDPISQFPLHVQESPSLELDILATSRVYLKIGLHPSSSLCHSLKNVPPYIVWGLIRYSFSAKADKKYTSPLIVPRFQLSTKRSHGPLTTQFSVQHHFCNYSITEAIFLENIKIYILKYANAMDQGKTQSKKY